MSNGERRDDSFVERLGGRIGGAPAPPTPPGRNAGVRPNAVLGPGDFADESTSLSRESEPPPPPIGTLPAPAEGSGLFDAPAAPPPASRPEDAFSEFEATEMPGESTRIEESEIIADQSTAILDEGPKMPFLFVESGKDKNKEYVLQEGETGVGRGIDNDVILTDVSVSRKHLRVLRDGANLVLRDLGSGNGTTVNGTRVHQVTLNEGDRIELGETVLIVRRPPEGAITAVGALTHETALPQAGGPQMIPAWPTAPQPASTSGSLETVAPRDGHTATVRLPRRTLALAVAGVAAIALLLGVAVGGVLLMAGRSGETVSPLPITTATPVITAIPQPVAVAPIGVPVGIPATGVPVGIPATGVPVPPPTAIVMAPPATGIPVPPTTLVEVAAIPPASVAEAPADPEPAASSSHGSRSPRAPRPTREVASSGLASAQTRVTNAYNAGDFDGASAIARDAARHATGADQRSLETLANNIDSFAGLYPRIRGAGDALGPVAGTVPIALRLDRQIVSGGHYGRDIQPRYVRFLVTQARGQIGSAPQTACPRVRDALELDAGNADAQGLARQCETAASRMLSDAQSHERSDAPGAQRSYQAIQQMVPRTSATFRTAGERLAALRTTTTHARPVDEDE